MADPIPSTNTKEPDIYNDYLAFRRAIAEMAPPAPVPQATPQPEPPFVSEARRRREAGMDKSVSEAQRDAMAAALANILGQAGGLASYLPVGEENRSALRDFAGLTSQNFKDASDALSDVAMREDLGILGEAAVRYPVSVFAVLPEIYNPAKKLNYANYANRGAQVVAKYGPDVINTAWHTLRGYSSDGPRGGAVSGGSHLVGEKLLEPALRPVSRRLGLPADLAGNAGGTVLENIINEIISRNEE